MRLVDLLKISSTKYPDRIAIRDDFCKMPYSKLLADAESLSDFLQSAGCKPGVKIALLLPNSAIYFTAFFAVSASGATIVPMSSKMTVYEASGFILRADVSMVLAESGFAIKLTEQLDDKRKIVVVTLEYDTDVLKVKTFIDGNPRAESENSDVALMVYTSGTTDKSKIVMLTDDQLISNMFIYRALMDFNRHNIVYCSLLLYHIYCICAQVLTHINLGDTFIVTDKPFFIKDFLQAVQNHKVTITAFVPYLAMLMAEYQDHNQFDTSSLKHITLAGAKTPKTIYQKLTKKFDNINFVNTYGMTEAGCRIAIAAPRVLNFPIESVGKPMPGVQVRISDGNGKTLPTDCIGEIQIKSSGIFKGYFNQPQLTKEAIVDGWLKTGDLGKLDSEGNLFLTGRIKEIILCGGENMFPCEIEEIILENELVNEVAVIGIPDEKLEEVPCAFIVLKNPKCKEADIIKLCRKKLSNSKVPRKIFFIEQMPKLGTSKIDRRRLKAIAIERLKGKS